MFWMLISLVVLILLAFFILKKTLKLFLSDSNEPVFLDLENRFLDPVREKSLFFPSLKQDSPEVTLTIVVPAYNEEERLESTLVDTIKFLKKRQVLF